MYIDETTSWVKDSIDPVKSCEKLKLAAMIREKLTIKNVADRKALNAFQTPVQNDLRYVLDKTDQELDAGDKIQPFQPLYSTCPDHDR